MAENAWISSVFVKAEKEKMMRLWQMKFIQMDLLPEEKDNGLRWLSKVVSSGIDVEKKYKNKKRSDN